MIRRLFVAVMLVATMIGSALSLFPSTTYACSNVDQVFGVTTWFRGLQSGPDCAVTIPQTGGKADFPKFITLIALNVVQAGLALAAYITVFFIMKGGFEYMTSTGSSDGMANAKKSITNAIIGLIIAVLSASIVNAIAGVIK